MLRNKKNVKTVKATIPEIEKFLSSKKLVPVRNIDGINETCDYLYVNQDGEVCTVQCFRHLYYAYTFWSTDDLKIGDHFGYIVMSLRSHNILDEKQDIRVKLHRAVMQTFNPNNNPELTDIDHIDGDKTNNSLSNLEWTTHKENLDRYWSKTRKKRGMLINCCGEYPHVVVTIPLDDNTKIRYHKCKICGKLIKSNNINIK